MRATIHLNIIALIALSLLVIGCQKMEDHKGVMGVIDDATTALPKADLADRIPEVKMVKVSEPYQGGSFYTETRKDKIGRFPCSGCHNGDSATIANAREEAHGEIVLNHGAVTHPDACQTCHSLESRDFLVLDNGTKVDFDHSYQKCAQCHFRQKKDWLGGAHGKRVTYWSGTRVIKNCTSCHNPHSPRFEKRWPVTYSPSDVVLGNLEIDMEDQQTSQ